jgi:hypothetical protein
MPHTHLRFAFIFILTSLSIYSFSQKKKQQLPSADTAVKSASTPTKLPTNSTRKDIKSFKEVISDKAISTNGMFNIHKVEDKYYFEIPDSLLGRDILTVARISKGAVGVRAGINGYAGDEIGQNLVRFDKGPNNKLFLKNISYQETGRDSLAGMYWNVINSNMQPIAAAFDIKALSDDSSSIVIDVTELLNGDNETLFFDNGFKRILGIGGAQSDKSYIVTVKSFPENVEIKTVKTFSRFGGGGGMGQSPSAPQNATFEINSSLVLLPKVPMQARYSDDRIGYFTTQSITDFDLNPQGIERIRFIRRFRLEPKDEDMEKYKRGELVEPKKPIIYYIDPTTPKKWIPYLIQGINDWQVAFEKAGFKNAIVGKAAPTNLQDSTWSIDDARHNAIIYKPSEIANAQGPTVIDPRSGEIIETHINWYHNVMTLLRSWYMVQAAAADPRARKMQFDDELMGELIRTVSSHEVGHTLGLLHNFGSSSTVPVEKLRDKNYVEANGHTPSIMDYARFNYVAQPEDGISAKGFLPRIGEYDKWAIEWGYRLLPQYKNSDEEKGYLNKWAIEKLTSNPHLWWGDGETNRDDPRCQTEDLGDNAMKASSYGVKNLQRIITNLPAWTKESNKDYSGLREVYIQVVGQFGRYIGHVSNNIGGIERNTKRVEQTGAVYSFSSKAKQKEAVSWLGKNVFTTPKWVTSPHITSLINIAPQTTIIGLQDRALNNVFSAGTISKLLRQEAETPTTAYTFTEMATELRRNIFSELANHQSIDIFRRALQKSFTEKLIGLLESSPPGFVITIGGTGGGGGFISPSLGSTSDAISIAKAQLRTLQTQIKTSLPTYTDASSRNHLLDLSERIDLALKPR